MKKREPVVIDVKPEELHRETAHREPRKEARSKNYPFVRKIQTRRDASLVEAMQEIEDAGQIVQNPDFWLGVIFKAFTHR